MSRNNYFLSTGNSDQERMAVLNKLYSPFSFDFLVRSGLQKNLTILVYGCRTGDFAIELARYLTNSGKVIAIDTDQDSLQIAQRNAQAVNITNIEFKLCEVEKVAELNTQFDLIYGLWALAFTENITTAISQLFDALKSGGILVCEEYNFAHSAWFSFPPNILISRYHELALDNAAKAGAEINSANRLYHEFKNKNFKHINIETSQPVRKTVQEKSTYRLGLISMAESILKNKLCSEGELQEMMDQFMKIENSDTIIGGYRNILVSGIKSE